MRRREFIALLSGTAAVWPIATRSQRHTPARIGILASGSEETSGFLVSAFLEGMRENGFQKGRDYVLNVLWSEGDYERFPKLATELLQSGPDIILVTTIMAARAAQYAALPTTAIIMTSLTDPVGTGLIDSLSRPGGNITGISTMAQDLTAKGLELIREIVPAAKTFAVLFNSANPINRTIVNRLPKEAEAAGAIIQPVGVSKPGEFELIFKMLTQQHPDALVIVADGMMIDQRELIATFALQHTAKCVADPRVCRRGRAYWVWLVAARHVPASCLLRQTNLGWQEACRYTSRAADRN
jgi:putative ABC transport system substrate-binding protein